MLTAQAHEGNCFDEWEENCGWKQFGSVSGEQGRNEVYPVPISQAGLAKARQLFTQHHGMLRTNGAIRMGIQVGEPAIRHADYTFGEVTVDFARHQATSGGRLLDLTPTEFKMLRNFIENRGRVLTHDEIIERVWGSDTFLTDRVLYTHVSKPTRKDRSVALGAGGS